MQLLLSQFLCAFVLRVNAKQVNSGGVLLESRDRGGGVPPVSQHPDPSSDSKNGIFHTHFQTWGPFSRKSRYFVRARKAELCLLCLYSRSHFQKFSENFAIKLSVNEEKLTGFWARRGADYCPAARNCATIQQVWISKFAFGSEKFLGLSRNGPVVSKK